MKTWAKLMLANIGLLRKSIYGHAASNLKWELVLHGKANTKSVSP